VTEHPLTGGRITQGVVRVGDTVRRPASARSAFTRDLLQLLDRRGFDAAPDIGCQLQRNRRVGNAVGVLSGTTLAAAAPYTFRPKALALRIRGGPPS
jgi:hypothetical protein